MQISCLKIERERVIHKDIKIKNKDKIKTPFAHLKFTRVKLGMDQ